MSDEPTKDLEEKYETKPTIETVIRMLAEFRDEMRAGFKRMDERFGGLERKLEDFDVRLDRVASDASKTRSEFLELRADFREFRRELREHFKEPA
jgi:archaellum component FlaC